MPINEQTILHLCNQGESNRLDYKREQYKFIGRSDHEKSELLKDILALANADRSETAFILIGVNEVNHRGEICGISAVDLIDDATIQQFINDKLNRKIIFSVYRVDCAAGLVQVIEIPECLDSRPFYPKNDYGHVNKQSVKIKIGSYTVDATPDEIAGMGKTTLKQRIPELKVHITSPTMIGENDFFLLSPEFNIREQVSDRPMIRFHLPFEPNQEEKKEWIKKVFSTFRIDVYIENISNFQADDMKAECLMLLHEELLETKYEFPERPKIINPFYNQPFFHSATPYNLSPGEFSKVVTGGYWEFHESCSTTLRVRVYAKDMPFIEENFHLKINCTKINIDKELLDQLWNPKNHESDIYKEIKSIYNDIERKE